MVEPAVSAIIVTRGNVSLDPVLDSLPMEWEIVVWDNGSRNVSRRDRRDPDGQIDVWPTSDLSVYGRYAAIEHATHDLIYVQDDDVIVIDPQAIVDRWLNGRKTRDALLEEDLHALAGLADAELPIVANMPQEFRHDGYTDSCLVGFGACFHRSLPGKAFLRYFDGTPFPEVDQSLDGNHREMFLRTCDVVFTTLTPRVLVDVPKENLDYAYGENRMWRQPDHIGERTRMLELARAVRDA